MPGYFDQFTHTVFLKAIQRVGFLGVDTEGLEARRVNYPWVSDHRISPARIRE